MYTDMYVYSVTLKHANKIVKLTDYPESDTYHPAVNGPFVRNTVFEADDGTVFYKDSIAHITYKLYKHANKATYRKKTTEYRLFGLIKTKTVAGKVKL